MLNCLLTTKGVVTIKSLPSATKGRTTETVLQNEIVNRFF